MSAPPTPPPPPPPAGETPPRERMTTAEILAACRRGDRRAEETLFHQYFSRLLGLTRRRLPPGLGRRVDPEDVVLSAYRSFFVGLRGEAGFAATETPEDLWALLCTITRRKIAKQARRHHARRRAVGQEHTLGPEIADAIEDGEAPEAAAMLSDEVEQLVATLGKTDREILMQLLEGATSAEIAEERGCSERTVRRSRERIDQAIASRRDASFRRSRFFPPGSTGSSETARLTPTHREGDILLQELAGEGSFAKVYRALDRTSGKTAAVKFLRKDRWTDPRAVAALLREYQILQELRHPGIVAVHGWGTTRAGAVFLVLEWIDGETIETWVREPHSLKEILATATRVAEALIEAHHQRILHGDLSPANILRETSGRTLLTDFGFARWSSEPALLELRGGTPGYLAPEVLDREAFPSDRRQDVYGFSALLLGLLGGKTSSVRGDKPLRVEQQIEQLYRTRGSELSPGLLELIGSGLESEPAARPAEIKPYLDSLTRQLSRCP